MDSLNLSIPNPINCVLILLIAYLFSHLIPSNSSSLPTEPTAYNWRPESHSHSLLWRSWTPEELRGYDGTSQGKENGRILFAIRRKVYDVSAGRSFYGPGGPYAIFAGRDASRGLAKQSFETEMLTPLDEPIDDLKDLTTADWDNLKDWEGHFGGKYIVCGDYIPAI